MKAEFPLRHLKRYKDIAALLWKYGRSDLAEQLELSDDERLLRRQADLGQGRDGPTAEQLADDLEAMGPTFVKLGQVLASRPDFLPDAYVKALSRLHNKVKPFSFGEVQDIVE